MKSYLQKSCIALSLICILLSCKKSPDIIVPPPSVNTLLKIDNVVFDTTSSKSLSTHLYGFDTQKQSYTLQGFGAFAGKSRIVKFTGGGYWRGVPVVQASGFDDYGYTYLAKDTSGTIWELYQNLFDDSKSLFPYPITVFAPKQLLPATEWNSCAGWEKFHNIFKTRVIDPNAVTSTGITGCIQLEYSAPDYIDTVFIKPGTGPVEVLSWREYLNGTNRPGYGGYR